MKTILAPIDFSESSKLVIAESVKLARATGARVVLLHVVQPLPGSGSDFGFAEPTPKTAGAAVQDAVRRLTHLQRQLSDRGVTIETFHTVGVPAAAIVARAQEFSASHIVVGSHGHGALYELLVGGTTSRVLKEATCSVLVVPRGRALDRDAATLNLGFTGDGGGVSAGASCMAPPGRPDDSGILQAMNATISFDLCQLMPMHALATPRIALRDVLRHPQPKLPSRHD